MSEAKLDPSTQNIDLGVCITDSGVIPGLDTDFEELYTYIVCVTSGVVTYYNKFTDVTGAIPFEAGEGRYMAYTKINSSGTTVPPGDIYWGVTSSTLGK